VRSLAAMRQQRERSWDDRSTEKEAEEYSPQIAQISQMNERGSLFVPKICVYLRNLRMDFFVLP
jgi:hypothetical protein